MDENRLDDVFPAAPQAAEPTGKTKPDRATVKAFKKQGRADGAQYIKEKKACTTAEETKAFKKKWRAYRKETKTAMKAADRAEKTARKKGMKAFRHRIHRKGRIFRSVIAVLLLACLVFFGAPRAVMFTRAFLSQRYTNSGADVEIARAAGYALSAEICDEGFVLLKNDDGFLPLQEKKLSVFSGSASLTDALAANSIASCDDLNQFYLTAGKPATIKELVISRLPWLNKEDAGQNIPGEDLLEKAKAFSDQALIVLSAENGGKDLSFKQLQPMAEGSAGARLLDAVCSRFAHVILVIDSGNVMELGPVRDRDSIDAVIWADLSGTVGCTELAKILTGEVNPSGRSTDTWPVSLTGAPSASVKQSGYYANLSGLQAIGYNEGIYVGYRYYETRFGEDEEAYAREVVFPFGHGLSYTAFSETLTALSDDGEMLTAEITVTNTGETAGKDVVQLYCLPPYAEAGVEKSAVVLAGFDKTALLAPGGEEEITLTLPLRTLASWCEEKGCYLLSAGEYRFAAAKNAHDALITESFETVNVEEDLLFETDETTGTRLQNLFADVQGELETVSRSAWGEGETQEQTRLIASDALKQTLREYEKAEDIAARGLVEPAQGEIGSLKLADLKGLDYDDPAWDTFLAEFTVHEMIRMTANGGYHTEAIPRLGVPGMRILGAPDGIKAWRSAPDAVRYPASVVLGASWNTALAEKYGRTVAAEAAAYGVNGWYAPDAAVHRTATGGSNAEGFSEDPLLAGAMAAGEVKGAQNAGLLTFVQGFACGASNLSGNNTCLWVSEQALREIWLRPYEIAVKEGGAKGIAVSSARLGVKWCGASSELLNSLLREEWGFRGMVTTVDGPGSWMNAALAAANGTDLMRDTGLRSSEWVLYYAYAKDRAATANSLRQCVHDICYTIANDTDLV